MLHLLATSSAHGNPVEGAVILVLIIAAVLVASVPSTRHGAGKAIKRASSFKLGPNPKSRVGQTLIGTRDKNRK